MSYTRLPALFTGRGWYDCNRLIGDKNYPGKSELNRDLSILLKAGIDSSGTPPRYLFYASKRINDFYKNYGLNALSVYCKKSTKMIKDGGLFYPSGMAESNTFIILIDCERKTAEYRLYLIAVIFKEGEKLQ